MNNHSAVGFPVLVTYTDCEAESTAAGTLTDKCIWRNILNTWERESVSSGYPNTEKKVENTTRRYFANVHQVKTKKIITVNKHRFLRFYFSVYSLVFVSTEKIYQTLETVFHRLSKHLKFRQKYSAARRIFNSLLGVWISRWTLPLVFDILLLKSNLTIRQML